MLSEGSFIPVVDNVYYAYEGEPNNLCICTLRQY